MKTNGAILWEFNQPWSVEEIEIDDPRHPVERINDGYQDMLSGKTFAASSATPTPIGD